MHLKGMKQMIVLSSLL